MAKKKNYNLLLYELQKEAINNAKITGGKVASNSELEKIAQDEYLAPIKDVNLGRKAAEATERKKKQEIITKAKENTKKTTSSSKTKKSIKTPTTGLEKVGHVAKSFGSGILSGVSGLFEAGTTELANNLNKGQDDDYNLMDSIFYLLNPTIGMQKTMTDTILDSAKTIGDKEKTPLQKAASVVNNATTTALEVTTGKGILDQITQIAGHYSPDNAGDAVMEASNKVTQPVYDLQQDLYYEGQQYGGATQFLGETSSVVGRMIPSALTTLVTKNPQLGMGVMATSVKGSSTTEALKKGAELDEAVKIGNTKGMIEYGTELLFGGVNIFGKGALDDIIEKGIDRKVKNEVLNYIAQKGISGIGGELVEETISDVLNVAVDKGTVDPNASYSFKDWGEMAPITILSTLVINALTGGYGKTSYQNNVARMQQNQKEAQAQGLQQEIAKKTEELNKSQDVREKQIIQETINGLNEELNELTNAQQITDDTKQVEQIVQETTNKNITVDTANTKAKLDTIDYATNNQITELSEEMQKIKEEADSIGINTVFYSGKTDNPYLALTHEGTIYLDVNEVEGEPSYSTRYSHDLLHALARHDNAGIKETINELKERIVNESSSSIDQYVESKGYSSENLTEKQKLDMAEEVLADYVAKARNGYEIDYNLPGDIEYVLNQAVQDGITESQIRQAEKIRTLDNQDREVNKEILEELKDSQARDDKGKLLTVYHGTPNGGFTEFDINKRGTATDIHGVGDYGKGFYFTPVKEGAESYTKSDYIKANNPQVYEAYLNLKNPLRLDIISSIQKDINALSKEYGALNIPDAEIDKVYEKYNITEEQYDEMSTIYDNLGDNWQDIDISEYGYDGIINENRTEYVAFDPKQIKILNESNNKKVQSKIQEITKKQSTPTQQEIDNLLDIQKNKSGSEYASAFFALRDKYGQVELYKALNEAYSKQKAGNNEVVEQVEETIAPIQETMEQLDNKLDALQKQLTEMQDNLAPTSQDIVEQQGQEDFANLPESEMPSEINEEDFAPIEDTYEDVSSPVQERDIQEVGNRKVKAYQYEHPEVRPYFQVEADNMLGELQRRIEGERFQITGEDGYPIEWAGVTRQIPEFAEYLKDNYNYTYEQIEKGLKAIIEDNGAENNAVSKRLEILLDERLTNGYVDFLEGYPIPPNQEYKNLLIENDAADYYSNLAKTLDDAEIPVENTQIEETTKDMPMYEKIEPLQSPITKENIASQQTTSMKAKTAQNGNTDVTEAKQRKWVKTSTESEVVNREILPDDLDQSKIYYQPITNKATLNTANVKLDSLGYEKAVEYFNNQILNKTVKVEDIVLGERLIQEAIKNKDTKTAGELIQNVAILGTELGQKVQALSIIQRMTPEGQLKMLEKTINRGKAKGDNAFTDVNLTQEMKDKILKTYNKDGSYDQDKLNEVMDEVKQEVADQMQVTVMDKINDWRYLSMLGNPKTHIRNLVSNVAMKGTVAVKNAVARTVETIAPIENRTKTWKAASNDVINFAKQTTLEMKDVISGDSKYSETADIKAKRKTFNSKFMNWLTDGNSNLLEKEDWWFSKGAFESSFREFLTANGIETKQDIQNNPELIEKGKNYAVEQAQIATFRQYSWLANKIRDIESRNAATQIAVGAVLPFKKTPINIAKTGLSYSPLGFAKTLTYDIAQVKKGNMEASTLIDHIAQNTTGTALTLVGYMLAQAGFLNGAGDDDKEGKYDYQLGKQAYSINIDGSTYSLSWLSPVAMPLFVGANAFEKLVEGEEWNADVVLETLGETLDPLSEMSFLSSLDSVLSSYDSGVQRFFGIGEAMVQNYVTQFVPTASSQLAATLDDTKRSTKVSGDSTMKVLEETYNKLIYKIPGLRETLEPTTDIWGNEIKQNENLFTRAFENFIAPYARKDSIATEIDEELKDLYSQTGDNGILPSIPYNYVNYDGEKYNMSAEEYTDYKKMYGQTANDLLEDLFRTTTYKNATSEERTDMVNDVYDYARDEAKLDYLAKEGVDYTNATEDKVEVYKENLIKGAVENDMTTKEYGLYLDDPEEYKFLMEKDYEYRQQYFNTYDSLKEIDEAFEEQKDGINDDDELDALYSEKKNNIIDKIINSGLEDTEKASLYKKHYNSDTVDTVMKSAISIDDYLIYETKEFKADKNAKGNSIPGSRKDKVIDYVNTLNMNIGQKAILIKSTNTFKFNDYNVEIVRYLDSLGLQYDDFVSILNDLDMTVKGDTVYWE